MAKQKTSTATNEQVVESTVESTAVAEETVVTETKTTATPVEEVVAETEAPKALVLVSSKNVPMYKIASKQRNMEIGTIVAGHTYPYVDKTRNAEGIFYNIGRGYVYADDCVKIQ